MRGGRLPPRGDRMDAIVKHRLRILLAAVALLLSILPSPGIAGSAKVRQGVKQVAARQYKKALNSFRDALRKDPNDAEAMTRIGDLHASGLGVPRSDKEAARWYAKAASLGNAAARFALAARYASGRGVGEDPAAAAKWCRLAADQGHPGAQSLLGYLYEQGMGVPRDEAESLAWYRKAAEGGDVASQKLLAWRHLEGNGVPKDPAAAAALLQQVADDAREHGLIPRPGREVLEIRPGLRVDKGTAVRALLARSGARRAVYFGDDWTDVDAWRALRALRDEDILDTALAVGVRSSEVPTEVHEQADHLVDGPEGVLDALRHLAGTDAPT